jgi:hypothetical protein
MVAWVSEENCGVSSAGIAGFVDCGILRDEYYRLFKYSRVYMPGGKVQRIARKGIWAESEQEATGRK